VREPAEAVGGAKIDNFGPQVSLYILVVENLASLCTVIIIVLRNMIDIVIVDVL
jgi:hypothetical protein